MGADLSIAVLPITRPKQEALGLLRAMSDNTLLAKIQYTHLDDDETIFDDDGKLIRSELMTRLEESLNIAYECAEGALRLGGYLRFGECEFAVAGGPSWGEAPDYVDDLSIIYFLGVTYDETMELKWVPR